MRTLYRLIEETAQENGVSLDAPIDSHDEPVSGGDWARIEKLLDGIRAALQAIQSKERGREPASLESYRQTFSERTKRSQDFLESRRQR